VAADEKLHLAYLLRIPSLQQVALLLSILAAVSYGALYVFYWSFYTEFGVNVVEVGLSQAEIIARAFVGAFAGVFFVVLLAFLPPWSWVLPGAIIASRFLRKHPLRSRGWQRISGFRLPGIRLALASLFVGFAFTGRYSSAESGVAWALVYGAGAYVLSAWPLNIAMFRLPAIKGLRQ
jgi:hypothetical protein